MIGQGGGQLGSGHGGLTYLPDLLNISCSTSSPHHHLTSSCSNSHSPSRSGSPPHLCSLPLPGIETFTQDGSVIHVSEVHQVAKKLPIDFSHAVPCKKLQKTRNTPNPRNILFCSISKLSRTFSRHSPACLHGRHPLQTQDLHLPSSK